MREQEFLLSCGRKEARVQRLLYGISFVEHSVSKCDEQEVTFAKEGGARDGTVQR